MKTQIATDKEQSARLLACGVKPETADMFIGKLSDGTEFLVVNETESDVDNPDQLEGTPAWSLSALLALLPMEISKDGITTKMSLVPYPDEEECYRWCISYYDEEVELSICYAEAPDPISCCVSMIEKLTANGYSLNNIEQ